MIILKSIGAGIAVTILAIVSVFLFEDKTAAHILLLPIGLLEYLAGPKTPMGYGPEGQALYEGTPADLFIMLFGLLLCVPYYSIISFIFFLIWENFKNTSSQDLRIIR